MKKILVTGASGLLGLNFSLFYHQKYFVTGIANHTRLCNLPFRIISYDLLSEHSEALLDQVRPDVVLHCAALANIDVCEKNPQEAEAINSLVPGTLAAECAKRDVKFVHISTDAVFDGEDCGSKGYTEDSLPNPISRYALTKLEGERNVLKHNPDALVARVNFYGWSVGGKRSLVEFFYNNLSEGRKMNGFSDVYFSTLYVHQLAELLDEMIELDARGIYHVFSADYQSKYEFGVAVAKKFGFDPGLVVPVSWKDGALAARRSPNLIMNTDKLRDLLGHDLPKQEDGLQYFYEDTCSGLRDTLQGFGKTEAIKD